MPALLFPVVSKLARQPAESKKRQSTEHVGWRLGGGLRLRVAVVDREGVTQQRLVAFDFPLCLLADRRVVQVAELLQLRQVGLLD